MFQERFFRRRSNRRMKRIKQWLDKIWHSECHEPVQVISNYSILVDVKPTSNNEVCED